MGNNLTFITLRTSQWERLNKALARYCQYNYSLSLVNTFLYLLQISLSLLSAVTLSCLFVLVETIIKDRRSYKYMRCFYRICSVLWIMYIYNEYSSFWVQAFDYLIFKHGASIYRKLKRPFRGKSIDILSHCQQLINAIALISAGRLV